MLSFVFDFASHNDLVLIVIGVLEDKIIPHAFNSLFVLTIW